MSLKTEGLYAPDVIKFEQPNGYSREKITVLAGSGAERALTVGMVLAQVTKGAATAAAVAGNTSGSGTIAAVTVGVAAKVGVYRLVCVEPGTNAGKFTVEDPDGILVGVATVAVEFVGGGLTFTITDATDFVSGDSFTITVAAGSGKWVQIDFAGTNGTDVAAGVLVDDVTAPDGTDAYGVAVVRDAITAKSLLVWPAGATSDQKAAALAQLGALGIISRDSA
jgi:hypothetical protein